MDDVVPGAHHLCVAKEDLARYLNFPVSALDEARVLFDFASSAGAMRVYCIADEWFNKNKADLSHIRAIPLLDSEAFLRPIDPAAFEDVGHAVEMPWIVPSLGPLQLNMLLTPTSVRLSPNDEKRRGIPVPTTDFILASRFCALERAYLLEFAERDEEGNKVVLGVYFHASQASRFKSGPRVGWVAERAVYKKRKSGALVEDGDEDETAD